MTGTILADDFIVIDKSSNTLMFHGGVSPREEGPREMDTFITLVTELDSQKRVVRFKIKSMMIDRVSNGKGALMGVVVALHQQYAKLLLTAGVDHCVA